MIRILLVALLLTGCERRPSREACSDYRWMTFAEAGAMGWNEMHTSKVCVVEEHRSAGGG